MRIDRIIGDQDCIVGKRIVAMVSSIDKWSSQRFASWKGWTGDQERAEQFQVSKTWIRVAGLIID